MAQRRLRKPSPGQPRTSPTRDPVRRHTERPTAFDPARTELTAEVVRGHEPNLGTRQDPLTLGLPTAAMDDLRVVVPAQP